MRCPTDGAALVMSERQGVEIDYCPSCRGIWLDRGELDKILERATATPTPGLDPLPPTADPRYGAPEPQYPPADPRYAPDPRGGYDPGYRDAGYREGYRDDYRGDPRQPYGKKRKRRESWLEDLFDF
ncbi:zf-TFIIB domain-containing protein [Cellulomonas sp. NPDC089187]|uniref:TFIIB-type zinc ribbon-containing protein n=1 Tax=Cellulomonas sp. NPDC089187 TaxID=3154970 RepID=UPI00343F4D19